MPDSLNVQLPDALPVQVQKHPVQQDASAARMAEDCSPLCWRVHLLKREPQRLPVLLLVVLLGVACVWLMFGTLIPVVAAFLLLMGSVSEYLFPIAYRLTDTAIYQETLTSRMQLALKDARRCRIGKDGLLLTSLPAPSRLDAFRGVLLRFAPDGQPGDKASVCAAITLRLPNILIRTTLPLPDAGRADHSGALDATSERLCVEAPTT